MRLRSDIFVAAYIRRRNGENAFAVVRQKGAAEAGAIFVKIDTLNGQAALYGPAPQSVFEGDALDRRFQLISKPDATNDDIEKILQREIRFDPDIWIVEVEDKKAQSGLDLVHI
jgi:hypothetical protein